MRWSTVGLGVDWKFLTFINVIIGSLEKVLAYLLK